MTSLGTTAELQVTFLVIQGLKGDVILGNDFLIAYQVDISYHRWEVTLRPPMGDHISNVIRQRGPVQGYSTRKAVTTLTLEGMHKAPTNNG